MQRDEEVVQVDLWLEKKAKLSERNKQFKEATLYWDKLLRRLTRTDGDVIKLAAIHYRLGLAHRALKDHLKSLYHLKYSIRLNASEARYYEAFGRAFLSGGHWRVAKAQFEKAVSLDPKNITYLRQYAWTLLMMGRKDDARLYTLKALKLKPHDRESQWSLVRIYMESEMFLQALELLRQMAREKPKSRRILLCIEECQAKLETTFEGNVLRCLRDGMKCDGQPFSIKDLRRAENLWIEYCLERRLKPESQPNPAVWAAALAWFVLYIYHPQVQEDFDLWLNRFGVGSHELWPCIKNLQEAIGHKLMASKAPGPEPLKKALQV